MCYNITCMKRFLFILALFLVFTSVTAYSSPAVMHKDISVQSIDGFNIKASFDYPKTKKQNKFSTVVLLHSLGYTSEWWESLPKELLDKGYAVLKVDLRGHGESVYNKQLVRTSWKNMTNSAYAKYPDDVIKVIEHINVENSKKYFFENWAIVGADIGANTAIMVAEQMSTKPKTLVLLSPTIDLKGLYVPVKLAHLEKVDILSISGTADYASEEAQKYLEKFAQSTFVTYKSESKSIGMLLLKNDKPLSKIITTWISEYLDKKTEEK